MIITILLLWSQQTNKTYTDTQTLKKHFLTHTHPDMARDYMPVLNRLPLLIKLWWESPDLFQNGSITATVVIGKATSWLKFTLGYMAFEKTTRTHTQNKSACFIHTFLWGSVSKVSPTLLRHFYFTALPAHLVSLSTPLSTTLSARTEPDTLLPFPWKLSPYIHSDQRRLRGLYRDSVGKCRPSKCSELITYEQAAKTSLRAVCLCSLSFHIGWRPFLIVVTSSFYYMNSQVLVQFVENIFTWIINGELSVSKFLIRQNVELSSAYKCFMFFIVFTHCFVHHRSYTVVCKVIKSLNAAHMKTFSWWRREILD